MHKACGDAHMKAILAVGDLGSMNNVYKASLVAMMAGSDFIKTSTGKEGVNATLPVGVVMCRAIREYYERTGHRVRIGLFDALFTHILLFPFFYYYFVLCTVLEILVYSIII